MQANILGSLSSTFVHIFVASLKIRHDWSIKLFDIKSRLFRWSSGINKQSSFDASIRSIMSEPS